MNDSKRLLEDDAPPRGKRLAVVIAVSAILVMVIFVYVTRILGPRRDGASLAYYYDLNTAELFVDAAGLVPPIEAPSGPLSGTGEPAGVRAVVFTCGSDIPAERFVAWLEKYMGSGGMKESAAADRSSHPVIIEATRQTDDLLVARVDPGGARPLQWIPAHSPEGRAIVQGAVALCSSGSKPRRCTPAE